MSSILYSSVMNKVKSSLSSNLRRFSTAIRRHIEDEGDWFYSSEWWGSGSSSDGQTVFRALSDKGNGVVSVLAYPSSKPVQLPLYLLSLYFFQNWLKGFLKKIVVMTYMGLLSKKSIFSDEFGVKVDYLGPCR